MAMRIKKKGLPSFDEIWAPIPISEEYRAIQQEILDAEIWVQTIIMKDDDSSPRSIGIKHKVS